MDNINNITNTIELQASQAPQMPQASIQPMADSKQADKIKMEDVLAADFGEKSSKIVASFKKTIQIEQYNPEVVQIDTECEFEGHMSNIERDVIANLLQCSLEYQVQSHLFIKGIMTQAEFVAKKAKLEDSCDTLLRKYETITGKSRNDILHRINSK